MNVLNAQEVFLEYAGDINLECHSISFETSQGRSGNQRGFDLSLHMSLVTVTAVMLSEHMCLVTVSHSSHALGTGFLIVLAYGLDAV
jgi:hypothetical protein